MGAEKLQRENADPIDLHDSVDERLVESELGVVVQRSELVAQQLGTELNADIGQICLSNIVSWKRLQLSACAVSR